MSCLGACLQDFIAGEHPPTWNRTYNLVTWQRSSNTWQAVPWFNNTLKDAGCGEPACSSPINSRFCHLYGQVHQLACLVAS